MYFPGRIESLFRDTKMLECLDKGLCWLKQKYYDPETCDPCQGFLEEVPIHIFGNFSKISKHITNA